MKTKSPLLLSINYVKNNIVRLRSINHFLIKRIHAPIKLLKLVKKIKPLVFETFKYERLFGYFLIPIRLKSEYIGTD